IDGILKVKFKLRITSKSKPMTGPDELLLLLARDKSVFPTKNDYYDITIIILF
ncbi:hypothetical protein DL95DRAFT_302131, partial [Leptodontidium sp. 2 PMI_412]